MNSNFCPNKNRELLKLVCALSNSSSYFPSISFSLYLFIVYTVYLYMCLSGALLSCSC